MASFLQSVFEAVFAEEPEVEEVEEEEEDEDEEEVEDPLVQVKEKCEGHCEKLKAALDECTARVESKSNTEETCTQELFDFLHCVDHCVAQNLFQQLK
eukprot:m.7679 g.7679  ORF g.7679 m.7679 type:complete len:98 (+) comp5272_c0_seq1:444-737(+)